ncbi:MAG TPA: hypothetical protein VIS74_03315 [Chthoniobacterales bacterium]
MGRFLRLLPIIVLLASARAQEPEPAPPPPPPPPPAPAKESKPPGPPTDYKERWEKLPPQEQERLSKHLTQHLKKWEDLSEAEKDRLRERGKQLFERGRKEVEKAISQLDFELSPDKRREFIKTYMEKRREIERKLREETEPRRQQLIAEAIQALKKDFGGKAAEPAPSATPAGAAGTP